jgi:hypothetical protein
MCKVTIHELKKAKKPVPGNTDGRPWTLFIMECVVSVDENTKTDIRTVKTFEQEIFQQINAMQAGQKLTFEADKKPDGAVFEYTLKKDKAQKQGAGSKGQVSGGQTNRQCCLKVAVDLERARSGVTGDVPTAKEIIATAEELLVWLEQGGSK